MKPTWIAEEKVVFANPGGARVKGRIAIGKPWIVDDREARCALALDGIDEPRELVGDSPLQALLLTLRFAGYRIYDFQQRGGRVLSQNGRSLADIDGLFGPLIRDPLDELPQRERRRLRARSRTQRR